MLRIKQKATPKVRAAMRPPSGIKVGAITGITDAVLDARTGGYYSKVRDVSDSMGVTDIKDQLTGGFDALMEGNLDKATEKLFVRSAVVPNVLARMTEGIGLLEELSLPSSESVVALTEAAMGPLPDMGSGQRVREDAKAFIETSTPENSGKQSTVPGRSALTPNRQESVLEEKPPLTSRRWNTVGGTEFDNIVDITVDHYLKTTSLVRLSSPPGNNNVIMTGCQVSTTRHIKMQRLQVMKLLVSLNLLPILTKWVKPSVCEMSNSATWQPLRGINLTTPFSHTLPQTF